MKLLKFPSTLSIILDNKTCSESNSSLIS